MTMKTRNLKYRLLLVALFCLHFNFYAQADRIALNSIEIANTEASSVEIIDGTPVTLLNYYLTESNFKEAISLNLDIDARNYVVGLINICEENKASISCQDELIMRTVIKDSSWFLEISNNDKESNDVIKLDTQCIKLMVYNKISNKKKLIKSTRATKGTMGMALTIPSLY